MAKGQFLSAHQKGIVNRYYATADTRVVTTLQELVSDLALAETDAAKTKLWKKAADNLAKTTLDPKRAAAILEKRDVKTFAIAVAELSSAPTAIKPSAPRNPPPRPPTTSSTSDDACKPDQAAAPTERDTARHSIPAIADIAQQTQPAEIHTGSGTARPFVLFSLIFRTLYF